MKFTLCFLVILYAYSAEASNSVVSKVVNPLPESEPEAPESETGGNFEGDVDMGPNADSQGSNRNALTDDRRKWPNGHVCYFFEPGAGEINPDIRDRIAYAVDFIKNVSCITFDEKSEPTKGCIKVTDKLGTGCFATLGYVPASWLKSWGYDYQKINIPTWCQKGSAIHEFLHALGFLHEQSRPDRDEHIRVDYDNIKEGKAGNFKKYATDTVTTLNLPYDYGSIMHYSGGGFSNNGKPTIVPVPDSSVTIGQRKGMSELDIQKLNKHYNCKGPATSTSVTAEPSTGPCDCSSMSDNPSHNWCKATDTASTASSTTDDLCEDPNALLYCAKTVCELCDFC